MLKPPSHLEAVILMLSMLGTPIPPSGLLGAPKSHGLQSFCSLASSKQELKTERAHGLDVLRGLCMAAATTKG